MKASQISTSINQKEILSEKFQLNLIKNSKKKKFQSKVKLEIFSSP